MRTPWFARASNIDIYIYIRDPKGGAKPKTKREVVFTILAAFVPYCSFFPSENLVGDRSISVGLRQNPPKTHRTPYVQKCSEKSSAIIVQMRFACWNSGHQNLLIWGCLKVGHNYSLLLNPLSQPPCLDIKFPCQYILVINPIFA